jgi:3-phytase
VRTTRVRGITVGSKTEGCVADDALGDLYISEEDVGVWKYGAEPTDGEARTKVDAIGGAAGLTGDIEGLALVGAADGTGYLLVSNQSSDVFAVYRREGTNAFLRNVKILDGAAIDGVTFTDGIDASWANLGAAFPEGVFVAQDDKNFAGATLDRQNFKLVPLQDVLGVGSPF